MSDFYEKLDGVREVLTDPATTSVRLVVNPEKVVIAEARRTYTYLSLFGYRVDAVVANRLLPEAVNDPWFDRWKSLQSGHLETIEEGFAPVPVLRADLAAGEVVGFDRLRDLGEAVYGDVAAEDLLHEGELLHVETQDDGRSTLVLPLPFTARDELDLGRTGDELIVRVGAYRRLVLLPDSLRRRKVEAAALRDETLRVTFSASAGRASVPTRSKKARP